MNSMYHMSELYNISDMMYMKTYAWFIENLKIDQELGSVSADPGCPRRRWAPALRLINLG